MSTDDSMDKWKIIIEEKPEMMSRVILDNGLGFTIVAHRVNENAWVDCANEKIDEEIIDKMVFWRFAPRPPMRWKDSNGLYHSLLQINLGIGSVCPLCGEELEGITSSKGSNCRVCVECSVGMVGGWNFGGWKDRDEIESEESDRILSKIKKTVAEVYEENPMSEDDRKMYNSILKLIDV
jgi:hypothetical protein